VQFALCVHGIEEEQRCLPQRCCRDLWSGRYGFNNGSRVCIHRKLYNPRVSQASRAAPVLDKVVCFRREVLAEIQTAWLPGRYKLPALDSEWQEDQPPAIRTHFFVRIHAAALGILAGRLPRLRKLLTYVPSYEATRVSL
jgi:hypothetical protein